MNYNIYFKAIPNCVHTEKEMTEPGYEDLKTEGDEFIPLTARGLAFSTRSYPTNPQKAESDLDNSTSTKENEQADKKGTDNERNKGHSILIPVKEVQKIYREERSFKKRFYSIQDEDKIISIALTPDKKFIVSATESSIRMFYLHSTLPAYQIPSIHEDKITSIAVTPNNKYIISGSADKSLNVFDFETKKNVHHFEDAHKGEVTSVAVTSDSKLIISGSADKSIKIFNIETKEEVGHFPDAHEDKISSVAVTSNNKLIISGSIDKSIKLFEFSEPPQQKTQLWPFRKVKEGTKEKIISEFHHFKEAHEGEVTSVAVTSDSKLIISGSADKSIKIFNIETKEEVGHILHAHKDKITSVAVTSDSRFIVSGSADKSLKVFKLGLETKKQIHHFQNAHRARITSVVAIDKEFIASASNDKYIKIFPLELKRETYHFPNAFEDEITSATLTSDNEITSATLTSDNMFIVWSLKDRSIQIFDLQGKKVIGSIPNAHQDSINSVAVTSNNKFIISGSKDQSIKVFDFHSKKQVRHFPHAHEESITSIAMTSNNKFIVSASDDKSIKVFELLGKQEAKKADKSETFHFPNTHLDKITFVTVTYDKRFLVSASKDKSIKVFNFRNKREVCYIEDAHEEVTSAAMAPNNRYIVSAGADHEIKVFSFKKKGEKLGSVITSHQDRITSLAVTYDSLFIVSGSADKCIKIFDVRQKTKIGEIENAHSEKITSVAVTFSEAKFIISGSADSSIKVFKFETQELVHHFKDAHEKQIVVSVTVTPDSKFIVSATDDNSLRMFDLHEKQLVYCLKNAYEDKIISAALMSGNKYIVFGLKDKNIKAEIFHIEQQTHDFPKAHQNQITSMAVSSDDKFIVSASSAKSIKVFDFQSKTLSRSFENPHEDKISSVVVTPDNKFLVSCSLDKSIKIFDLENNKIFHHFADAHEGPITSVAVTSDSRFIVSGSTDMSLKIFDLQTKQQVHHLPFAHEEITSVAVTSDNKFIVSISKDKSIKMFDFHIEHQFRQIPQATKDQITALAVTPNNKLIVSSFKDKSIQVLDIHTENKKVCQFQNAHEGDINSLAITTDSKYLVSGSADRSIKVFDLQKQTQVYHLPNAHEDEITSVTITSDSKFIVCGSVKSIKILEFTDKKEVKQFQDQKAPKQISDVNQSRITSLAVASNKYIVSAFADKSIVVFDIPTQNPILSFRDAHKGEITSIAVTSNSKYIISGSADKSLKIFELQKKVESTTDVGTKTSKLDIGPESKPELHLFENAHEDDITSVALTSDDKFIVSGSKDLSIKVFSLDSKMELRHIRQAHEDQITSVKVSSDSKFIISSSAENSIRVFDLQSEKQVNQIENAHQDQMTSMSLTPNNRWIVSGFENNSIKVLDFQTEKEIHHFPNAHEDQITSVTMTSDSKFIISASADKSLKIFNIQTERKVGHIPNAHKNRIASLAVTSDRKYLISGGWDKEVKVFKVPQENAQGLFEFGQVNAEGVFELSEGSLYYRYSHKDRVNSVVLTTDNKFIVSGSADRSIKVYDLQEKTQVHHLPNAHEDQITSVAVTSENKFIVSASADKSIRVFDFQTKQQVHHFQKAHSRWIRSMVVVSNKFIVSASADKSIKIFDLRTKQEVHHFRNAHKDQIRSVAVTSDSKFIVSCSFDRTAKVFEFPGNSERTTRLQNLLIKKKKTIEMVDMQNLSSEPKYLSYFKNFFSFFSPSDSKSNLGLTPDWTKLSGDLNFFYEGMKKSSILNGADDFLFDTNVDYSVAQAKQQPEFFVMPFCWTILHIVSVFSNHAFIKKMPEYNNFKMPFLLDAFDRTPFHYILGHKNMKLLIINRVFRYVCDYLDDCYSKRPFEFQKIIESLTPLLEDILDKVELKSRERFMNIAFRKSPAPYSNPIPSFGKSSRTTCSFDSPVLTQEAREKLLNGKSTQEEKKKLESAKKNQSTQEEEKKPLNEKESQSTQEKKEKPENEKKNQSRKKKKEKRDKKEIKDDKPTVQLEFRSNFLYLDYDISSEDMQEMIGLLKKQEGEEIFKTQAVACLISHLWNQAYLPLTVFFAIFSAFIVALSVYLTLEDRCLIYELILLGVSILFTLNEASQIVLFFENYKQDLWNCLDIVHLLLTISFLCLRLADFDDDLTRAWISTFIIVLGSLKWISLLRIFKPTRHLIQVILKITTDMWSFTLIIATIIFGFSIVFLVFNREDVYGVYLYQAYNVLYGPVDIDPLTPSPFSEKLIMTVLSFFLNVVLLNLLISIMGGSYEQVVQERVRTDSITMLEMMPEALFYKRIPIFFSKKIQSFSKSFHKKVTEKIFRKPSDQKETSETRKGFLISCFPGEEADEGSYFTSDLDSRTNELRKFIQERKQELLETIKTESSKLKSSTEQEILGIKQNLETMKQDILSLKQSLDPSFKKNLESTESSLKEIMEKMAALTTLNEGIKVELLSAIMKRDSLAIKKEALIQIGQPGKTEDLAEQDLEPEEEEEGEEDEYQDEDEQRREEEHPDHYYFETDERNHNPSSEEKEDKSQEPLSPLSHSRPEISYADISRVEYGSRYDNQNSYYSEDKYEDEEDDEYDENDEDDEDEE